MGLILKEWDIIIISQKTRNSLTHRYFSIHTDIFKTSNKKFDDIDRNVY